MKSGTRIRQIVISLMLISYYSVLFGQTGTNAAPPLDQSLVTPSPNAVGFQQQGNTPVNLSSGMPIVDIPIFNMKCGSLNLPINLNCSYNGLHTLQDAGWVGLGWNLMAGGSIQRIIQGNVDSSRIFGYNYGQFNIANIMTNSDSLKLAFNYYANNSYDLGPDVFTYQCNGWDGSFIRYNSKPWPLNYDKNISIGWPSVNGNIAITTGDGTTYYFGAQESTSVSYNDPNVMGPKGQTYISAWYLTQVISADKADTINLNYTSYTWSSPQVTLAYTLELIFNSGGSYTPPTASYTATPVIQTQILQSIVCRNTKAIFIPDATARTDINGTYPKLNEIDILDNISGKLIKKHLFTYEYFGQTQTNPTTVERLKLKQYKVVDLQATADTARYTFKYLNEYSAFPPKSSLGIDYFGYNNNAVSNSSLLPAPTSPYFNASAPSFSYTAANRDPSTINCAIGILDTIVYPGSGYTTFQFEQNDYVGLVYNAVTHAYVAATLAGPGVRVKAINDFDGNSLIPVKQRNYIYLADDGVSSSGKLSFPPSYSGPITINGNPTQYNVVNNGSGAASSLGLGFYYAKVTEIQSGPSEKHKTDNYFDFPYMNLNSYGLFASANLSSKIDYTYNSGNGTYAVQQKTINTFSIPFDTSFYFVVPYIQNAVVNGSTTTYTFSNNLTLIHAKSWNHILSQQIKRFDGMGDSMVTTLNYNYNSIRNLSSIQQNLADGKIITKKFKYPDDYISGLTGNMVTANIISPAIETQIWQQNTSTATPGMISGQITSFDQTTFKPNSLYLAETTAPLASLDGESVSGGKYSTLLSDSHYALRGQLAYDLNNNINQYNKVSDINVAYIWDYKHSLKVAETRNAVSSQVAYTSFESDGLGNWTLSSTVRDSTTAITGRKNYNLSNGPISKTGLTSSVSYIVSYWSKTGASFTVSNSTGVIQGKTVNGWTFFKHTISGTTSVSVSGSGNIDELRLYPVGALMTTHTFRPSIGITSECDPNNNITYYEYDGMGRVNMIKDQDQNVLKRFCYTISGQASECGLYYNQQQSGSANKSCSAGYTGSLVTYVVPANTYSATTLSQANQLAIADVNANVQAYANANGTCISQSFNISCNNTLSFAFTLTLTNTSTNAVSTYTCTPGSTIPGQMLPGSYNVNIIKAGMPGTTTHNYQFGSYIQTGVVAMNLSNILITSTTAATIKIY